MCYYQSHKNRLPSNEKMGWLDAGQHKHQLHVVNAGNTVRFIAPFVSAELMYTLMLFRSTFNCRVSNMQ
jgi:hypothetical protein